MQVVHACHGLFAPTFQMTFQMTFQTTFQMTFQTTFQMTFKITFQMTSSQRKVFESKHHHVGTSSNILMNLFLTLCVVLDGWKYRFFMIYFWKEICNNTTKKLIGNGQFYPDPVIIIHPLERKKDWIFAFAFCFLLFGCSAHKRSKRRE